MYKLIAIDLDGTLLDNESKVTEKNIETLNKLTLKGYHILFASGRRYYSVKEVLEPLDGDKMVLSNNGNIIRNTKDDKTLYSQYLNYDYVEPAIELGKKRGLNPVIHVDGFEDGIDMIIELEKNDRSYYDYLKGTSRILEVKNFADLEEMHILSVVYLGDRKKLADFANYLEDIYGETYKIYIMTNIDAADALMEIINPKVSKWSSILKYADFKGIKREEIIAIGDDDNDKEMIEKAGLGIAMKNSVPGILEIADVITKKDNDESGLSYVLKEYLKI